MGRIAHPTLAGLIPRINEWQELCSKHSQRRRRLMAGERRQTIQRYTSTASLVSMLSEKRITLLDPATWDDKNDVFWMQRYKERNSVEFLYALCLSLSEQTYHHWRVFAGSPDGVCISFYESDLRDVFEAEPNVEFEVIEYCSVADARKRAPLQAHDLKFLKHNRYKPEKEVRIVYSGDRNTGCPFPAFEFSLDIIERVTLSPWLSKPLVDNMKNLLRRIPDCENLKIYRSTLVDFKGWTDLAK